MVLKNLEKMQHFKKKLKEIKFKLYIKYILHAYHWSFVDIFSVIYLGGLL